jgi:hypothetical protein
MGKTALSNSVKLNRFVSKYGNSLSTDGKVLNCQTCNKKVNGDKKYYVTQHIATESHKNSLKQFNSKQEFIKESINRKSNFNYELCEALIAADIPIHKLENQKLKKFLEKWTKQLLPATCTLRLNYINDINQSVSKNFIEFSSDH